MKRYAWVAVVMTVLLAGAVLYRPFERPTLVTAQTDQTITVDVRFRQPYEREDWVAGDPCGYNLLTVDYPGPWPAARQVVIEDAGHNIVATIDLMTPFAVSTPISEWDLVKTGTLDERGYCVVSADVNVPQSAFYTFMVPGIYEWTMSAADLAERDWQMDIFFLPPPTD